MILNTKQYRNSAKLLLCDVNLILLYDYNVIAKEIKLRKWKAIIIGLLWEYNFLHLRRRFLITDV